MRRLISRLRSVVRGVWRRAEVEAEVNEEFSFHLERRAEDLVRSGLSPAEARRRARLEFGSTERYREKEWKREACGTSMTCEGTFAISYERFFFGTGRSA